MVTCPIYCLLHPSSVVVVGLFLWDDGLDVFAVELQDYSSSMCLFGAVWPRQTTWPFDVV